MVENETDEARAEEEASEPGFRINDKRKRGDGDQANDEAAAEDAESESGDDGADDPAGTVLGDEAGVHVGSAEEPKDPPIDFGNFVMSLAHTTLVALAKVEHPESGEKTLDIPTARQTIEILEMLQEKTQNNLEPEEERLLGSLLYDLRLSFVEAAAQKVDA